MPSVIVVGGGLAGLSAAAALGSAGFDVELFEARGFLGGRATSFPVSPSDENSEVIDNCQHVLLRCCVNLLDFYGGWACATGSASHASSTSSSQADAFPPCERGALPAPLHFAGSFLRIAVPRAWPTSWPSPAASWRSARERDTPRDLDRISMLDWLRRSARPRAPSSDSGGRCWSAPSTKSWTVWPRRTASRSSGWASWPAPTPTRWACPPSRCANCTAPTPGAAGNVSIRLRSPVESRRHRGLASGLPAAVSRQADYYVVCAAVRTRLQAIAPDLGIDTGWFEHSPITGIHLWFDRPVTDLPHATLLDRTMQWMFNKSEGRYLQLVVSASRELSPDAEDRSDRSGAAGTGEFFPAAKRGEAGKGARDQGGARHVFGASRERRCCGPEPHDRAESISGRRLDPLGLARDHGRRGAQRISGGGSGGEGGR